MYSKISCVRAVVAAVFAGSGFPVPLATVVMVAVVVVVVSVVSVVSVVVVFVAINTIATSVVLVAEVAAIIDVYHDVTSAQHCFKDLDHGSVDGRV